MSPLDPPANTSTQPDTADHAPPSSSGEVTAPAAIVDSSSPSTQTKPEPAASPAIPAHDSLATPPPEADAAVPAGNAGPTPVLAATEAASSPEEPRPSDNTESKSVSSATTTTTLKPVTTPTTTTATQLLSIETAAYVDPTPPTPLASQSPSRTPSNAAASRPRPPRTSSDTSPALSDSGYDEQRYASEDEQEGGSRSEIQSIMEQFSEAGGGPGAEEVMSPRLGIASPMLASPLQQHPPRKSSLEPLAPSLAHQLHEIQGPHPSGSSPAASLRTTTNDKDPAVTVDQAPPVPPKDASISSALPSPQPQPQAEWASRPPIERRASSDLPPMSPSLSLHRPPPPEPEPEPALPFDFHRFLEQLRNKKADPVARYLKSFLSEFGKRQWMVHEQVKIISDFLAFIANKMALCEVWRDVPDAEFDNAREGMEKLVMNRLYSQTFSPAIPPPQPIPGAKPKRRGGERPLGPGRRGQHQEDVERDEILAQKIQIYSWTREEHLDIPPVSDSGKRFLKLAQQELLKIKAYRAPRDKIICVLNCCKVIFGLLRHAKSDSSADSFMPMLIYVVLRANPENLVSNVQYILRFRNQDKLGGEAGYYLSSLMGAIQFVENMDRTTLTISDEEFEANVEAAVSAIAEKHRPESPPPPPSHEEKPYGLQPPRPPGESQGSSSRPSLDVDAAAIGPSTPRPSNSTDEGRTSGEFYAAGGDEKDAITGLLRSIQKPLTTIGRIFSDEPSSSSSAAPPPDDAAARHHPQPPEPPESEQRARQVLSAEEAAARQASAEVAEAQRLHRAEHASVVETLAGMFPDLDRDVISDVVYQKEGRVGLAVDACLALSA